MRIVIVGGGTAGWIAALMISKIKPNHEVIVIESSKIGIIGAGEGSTGLLPNLLNNTIWDFDCDLLDFIKETNATLKFGIKHKGWTNDVEQYYFGPLGGSPTSGSLVDYSFAFIHANNPKNLHLSTPEGILIDKNLSTFNAKTFKFDNHGTALHFDAHLVGQYFKKITTRRSNVQHIDNEVVDVILNEQGFIESVLFQDNTKIKGDFFIDASGFNRILMNKLSVPWVSYKKNLPVNSAMPFLLDYTDNEDQKPYTTAWAQKAGWMWQIPLQTRKGCGYVFDDNFISPTEAHEEIEKILGRTVTPIKVLKFDTGRLDKLWVKNCLAIGLCAAFAEPLEATSIHTTITQLINFTFDFLRDSLEDTLNQGSINLYNKRTNDMYDDIKDFLNVHYMGGRSDSDFWKYIKSGETQTEFVADILEMSKVKLPTNKDFIARFGNTDWGLWCYVVSGIGKLSPEISKKELSSRILTDGSSLENYAKLFYEDWKINFDEKFKNNMSYSNFIKFVKKTANY